MTDQNRFKQLTALVAAICFFVSSSSMVWAQTFAELGFDITAPSISHEVPDSTGVAGQMQTVSALITDNVAVKRATVHYIRSSAEQFQQADMTGDSSSTTWMTTIDTSPEDEYVLYYVVAEDQEGNRIQKGGQNNPLKLKLGAENQVSISASTNSGNSRTEDNSQLPVEPKWILIGLGVLAAGLLLGSSGGGSDDNGSIQSDDTCCTVTFNVENVGNN